MKSFLDRKHRFLRPGDIIENPSMKTRTQAVKRVRQILEKSPANYVQTSILPPAEISSIWRSTEGNRAQTLVLIIKEAFDGGSVFVLENIS